MRISDLSSDVCSSDLNVIGEARSAQEHTQHRPAARSSIRQRYKFPRQDMLIKAGLGNVDNAVQCLKRIAVSAQIERDQVSHAIGQHSDRWQLAIVVMALIKFAKSCMEMSVNPNDDDEVRKDP